MEEISSLRHLVGKNVRSLRKTKGWSQEILGEQAGLSYKFVGEVERGSVNPSLDSLEGIANALQVDIVELFLRNDHILLTGDAASGAKSALELLRKALNSSTI